MHPLIRKSAAATLLLVLSMSARSEITACTEIAALPMTIVTPGIYCLKTDLSATSGGITVATDDVVIDLNGHLLDGSSLGPTSTQNGIFASGRRHITVRNGAIRGFRWGIRLTGPLQTEGYGEHLVEKLRLDHNYSTGIEVWGDKSVIRENVVMSTAGSTIGQRGIFVRGRISRITDNEVLDTVEGPTTSAYGINGENALMAVVERNTVHNVALGPNASFGISVGAGSVVINNRVINMRTGILFSGIAMDNVVGGATQSLVGPPPPAGANNFTF
jgi:hypothetical protein